MDVQDNCYLCYLKDFVLCFKGDCEYYEKWQEEVVIFIISCVLLQDIGLQLFEVLFILYGEDNKLDEFCVLDEFICKQLFKINFI